MLGTSGLTIHSPTIFITDTLCRVTDTGCFVSLCPAPTWGFPLPCGDRLPSLSVESALRPIRSSVVRLQFRISLVQFIRPLHRHSGSISRSHALITSLPFSQRLGVQPYRLRILIFRLESYFKLPHRCFWYSPPQADDKISLNDEASLSVTPQWPAVPCKSFDATSARFSSCRVVQYWTFETRAKHSMSFQPPSSSSH